MIQNHGQTDAELTDAPGQDDEKSIPLMGMLRPEGLPEAADLENSALRGPSKLLGHGTLLMVLVFVVAAGALALMRLTSGDLAGTPIARDVEKKIEQTLAQLSNRDNIDPRAGVHPDNIAWAKNNAESMIRLLSNTEAEHLVPLENVKKNPFRLAVFKSDAPEAGPLQDTGREQRIRKLTAELAKLRLQTVMRGKPNIAVVNGEFYREGQAIGPFTVARIEPLQVELIAEGTNFLLHMDQGGRR